VKTVRVTPVTGPLKGAITLPGSKSITNRALLMAGLARGTSRLTGALKSDDTRHMATALRAMGVTVDEPDATTFVVTATGRLDAPKAPLFLGNAGTAMRFLTAAVAFADGKVVLDGDAHMRKRPIGPLVDSLRALGVEAFAEGGRPPVTVEGGRGFTGARVEIDAGLSSQYVSALLMASARAAAPVEVALKGADIGARGYVDLTIAAMRRFGATVDALEGRPAWRVHPTGYTATDFAVEPDASAATYPWAAEVLTGGAIDLGLSPRAFTQPDAKAWDVMRMFPRMPALIDGSQMQDAVPTLAVVAAFNQTPVRFTGIANLRVKECDRIRAVADGLNAISPGLATEEGDDLVIASDPTLAGKARPARIDVHADHRIAMAFALAGLKVGGVVIEDPAATSKTWPEYWDVLAGLGVGLEFEG
jgi:3-phosphoshikimate 1-carboxyvinyltransferase